MEIHHDRHHQAYVNNLNTALKDSPELAELSIHALIADLANVPDAIRGAVRNNGGGHANHDLFWDVLTPGGANEPSGDLLAAINAAFGSVDALKAAMSEAGVKRFGSGWSWLISAADGTLSVASTANQDSPVMGAAVVGCAGTPVLGIDVWEHAYYLKYQNKRPDYLSAIWSVVNWDKVAARYANR
jgi:Fe-Mn family superoxide dismutase